MVDKVNINVGSITGKLDKFANKSNQLEGQSNFKELLLESLDKVNQLQLEAEKATERLATGQTDNVAEVLSAVKKADIAFSLMMQIRNQLMSAYNEIRNMRI